MCFANLKQKFYEICIMHFLKAIQLTLYCSHIAVTYCFTLLIKLKYLHKYVPIHVYVHYHHVHNQGKLSQYTINIMCTLEQSK